MCGILGQFVKSYRRKETAQCSKCGEKVHLDWACKRQKDGSKHESWAMEPTLASPDEEYWAAFNQWETAGMLVDSVCTDHIVTNIGVFLDFVLIQSVVINLNGEACVRKVVGRGCVRISIPSNKGQFQCKLKRFFVCLIILQTSYQTQYARSGEIASLLRKKQLHETPEGNSGKTNTTT